MPEETYNIYDLLNAMRERPALYIGRNSIALLDIYLSGYSEAMHERGVKDISQPPFTGFTAWNEKRLGRGNGPMGWSWLIARETLGKSPTKRRRSKGWPSESLKTANDAAALARFYELLDKYRSKTP